MLKYLFYNFSAAIVVSTVMGVEALSTNVGVKMVSTLHSSTAVQGRISLIDGSILTAELDTPEEKMDIISVKYEIIFKLRLSLHFFERMTTFHIHGKK